MALNQRTLGPGSGDFNPKSISGLSLWLDGSDTRSLYTTDAGPVTPVSSPLDIAGCAGWWDGSDTSSMYTTDAGPVVPVNLPTDIAGCVGWYDSGDLSAMRQNSDGTGSVSAGDLVGYWLDKSPAGNHVAAPSTGQRPALTASAFNGRTALAFDGIDDTLMRESYSSQSGLSGLTRIAVVTQTASSATGARALSRDSGGGGFPLLLNGAPRFMADSASNAFVYPSQYSNHIIPPTMFASRLGSSALTVRESGLNQTVTSSGSPPATTAAASGRLSIGSNDGVNYWWQGVIAEYVIFNRSLSDTELARVEAYLAAKWGISGVHRSAAQEIAAVASPLELGGCAGWWDGADASTINRDANNLVAQWSDKSGKGRNLTQSDPAKKPVYSENSVSGRNAVVWPSTANGCQLDYLTAFTHQTVIVVCRYADGVSTGFAGTQGLITTSSALGLLLSGTTWYGAHPFATSFNFVRINGAAPVRVDGQTALPMPLRILTCRRDTPATQALIIGGERFYTDRGWSGPICEVIAFDRELTTNEALRVEKYLQQKWSTPTVPDPAPPVGAWLDKSGNGRNATQANSGERPALTASGLSGRKVVTFDGSNDGLGFSGGTRTQETWFAVWAQTGGSDTTQAVVSDGASGYGINVGSGAGKVFDSSWGSFSVSRLYFVYSGTGATLIAPNVTTVRRSSADGLAMFLDGVNRPSSFTATTANATTMARLGSVSSGSNRLGGYIAEVVCYDSPLTTADRARVEAYLATKWAILDVHKNSSAMTLPVQSPAELPGLDSWWDFSDSSTVTVDASQQVTSVAAKVGTNATLTPSFAGFFASYGDYINGRKAIFFGEGEYRRQLKTGLGVADPNTPLTVFMAFAPERNASVPVGNQALMSKGVSSDSRRFSLGYYPQTQGAPYTNAARLIYAQAGTSYDTGSTVSASASGCNILVFSAQPGDVRLWGDRTSTYSSTTVSSYGTTESTAGFSVGGNPEGGATRGAIGEVIIFRRILSDNERQRVEHYLRLKWRGDSDLQPTPPVGAWMDKSGKERHAVQSLSGSRPLIPSTTQNAKRLVYLDGSDDKLSIPSPVTQSDAVSMFVVARRGPASWGGGGAGGYGSILNSSGSTSNGPQLRVDTGSIELVGGTNKSSIIGTNVGVNSCSLISGTVTNRDTALYIDGAIVDSDFGAGAISTGGTRTAIGEWNPGTGGGGPLNAYLAEMVVYGSSLSEAQRQKTEKYLARKWGISLAPQVSNLDAQDWVNRVYQSGGTCSESTAKAVSTFCDAIDAANIRDRFYRLNLFCGGSSGTSAGLASCLTPLYRTPNKTVTNLFQHGTDMSNAVWLGGGNGAMTRTVSTEVGPLGYGYATKLITPITGSFAVRQMYQLLPTQNRQVTLSVWLKTNTGTKDIQWMINGEYLDTFAVTSTWTRYTKTYTSTISANDGRTALVSVSELNDAGHILAWGMQCEYGSAATDYTQPVYGNATDTNVGAFVASDYNETGAGGGLAAGTGKYLNTGLPQYVSPAAGSHLSVYEPTKPLTQSYGNRIGVRDTDSANEHVLTNEVDNRVKYASGAVPGNGRTGTGPYGEIGAFLLGVSTSATSSLMYKNGLASGFAGTPTLRTPSVKPYYVFALNSNNNVDSGMTSGRLASYSVGLGFDATEAAKYNDAMLAFQRALGRDRPTNDPAFASVTSEDARLWIDTVYANFGSVSVSTANAVNTFCNAIESANVRDRFYRLNLFCGGTNATTAGLNSCLTPLFKNWKSCSGRNLQKYGDVLTASAWTKSNSTASVSASERPFPYGPYANVLTANAGTGLTPYVVSTSDNFGYGTITVSAYLKAAGVTSARILLSASSGLVFTGSATSAYATVNLTTGAVSSLGAVDTATATSVGNGWWRFAVTATTINGPAGNMAIRIDLGTGNSFSPVGTESLLVWGVQAEEGSVATAYDPYPLGNVVDANAGGPFLGADYADTGTSGGLKGNGSNKYLNTGLAPNALPSLATGHLAVYRGAGTAANQAMIAVRSDTDYYEILKRGDSRHHSAWGQTSLAVAGGSEPSHEGAGLRLASRTSATLLRMYQNGTGIGDQTASVTPAGTARAWSVFAMNQGTLANYWGNATPSLSIPLQGYSIGSGMPDADVTAYSSAMQTFQRSLGRDRPSSDPMFASVTNEDAKLWIDNVYNNSGTVNSRTANAVNAFCNAIDAANIRDRFYRLNLFCGGESGTAAGLNACLTPLYRGPTRTGAQFGNAVDNNIGGASSFLSADYAETSGLRASNGTTKYLDTGLAPSAMPQSVYESMHLSAWHGPVDGIVSDPQLIGSTDSTNLERYWIQISIRATAAYDSVRLGRATQALSLTPGIGARVPAFLLGTRRDATSLKFFRNGVPDGETLTSTVPLSANPYPFFVFRNNTNGTPTGDWGAGANIRSYSIGDDMSDIQVAAFYAAQKAFQYAILRAL